MNQIAERLERDAICRAALGMWLKAGAQPGQLMSYLPTAELHVRLRSGAADTLFDSGGITPVAAESDLCRRLPTAASRSEMATNPADPVAPPG
jgi:hypothetical protein